MTIVMKQHIPHLQKWGPSVPDRDGDSRRDQGSGGGIANSAETEQLARFAVDEHNKKENAFLEFVHVVKAKEQVVAGTLHHLTVEAVDAGKKKVYEAEVWVKPWLNFKELQEFRHAADSA